MTLAISIFRIFRKFFDHFSNFSGTFCSFRSFNLFSSNSWRRCDFFGPKIVKIRAVLAICRSFEDFQFLAVHYLFHTLTMENCHQFRRLGWGWSGPSHSWAFTQHVKSEVHSLGQFKTFSEVGAKFEV